MAAHIVSNSAQRSNTYYVYSDLFWFEDHAAAGMKRRAGHARSGKSIFRGRR
jgi:hypothetical protein